MVRRDGYFTETKSRTWLFCLICALQRKRGEPSFDPLSAPVFPKYQSRLTTKLVNAFLFDVSATDPLVYSVAALTMLLLALLASALPAARAAAADPVDALRAH